MNHGVHRKPVDQDIVERTPEPARPPFRIDRYSRGSLESNPVVFDPVSGVRRGSVRQHETQELGQIALRRAKGRQLPVVRTEPEPLTIR
jgi:hypothetical protein